MLLNVQGDIYTHDPVIVKENGKYYRFQTGDLLPFFVSDDLITWSFAGTVFSENPAWTKTEIPGSTSFWAPEVVRRGVQWRIYYSVSTFGKNRSAIGLAVSSSLDPQSPGFRWTDCGPVIQSYPEDDFNAIDPAVFNSDETVYDAQSADFFLWGSFWGGLQLCRLDASGRPIRYADGSLKRTVIVSRNTEPNPVEGGFIFHHGGFYYLFAAYDFCCRGTDSTYNIRFGRSRQPEGPYIDKDGQSMLCGGGTVIRNGDSFERFAGPGHNTVFSDNGNLYLVYHAYDRLDGGKPTLMIEKLFFDDELWPFVD